MKSIKKIYNKIAEIRAVYPMGVNTWAVFAGSDNEAVVDGDFAILEVDLATAIKKVLSIQANLQK